MHTTPEGGLTQAMFLYPLLYTPLSHSKWPRSMALRRPNVYKQCPRMGQNRFKWAKKHLPEHANGLGIVLEKNVFDPFLPNFCSHKPTGVTLECRH